MTVNCVGCDVKHSEAIFMDIAHWGTVIGYTSEIIRMMISHIYKKGKYCEKWRKWSIAFMPEELTVSYLASESDVKSLTFNAKELDESSELCDEALDRLFSTPIAKELLIADYTEITADLEKGTLHVHINKVLGN